MLKPPCKGCQSRTVSPNCHEICEAYLAYHAERELILTARANENDYVRYFHDNRKQAVKSKYEILRKGVK